MKDNGSTDNTPSEYEEEIKCMKERLTRCLQLLKVNQDSQIGKTAGLVNTLVVTTINSTTERGVVIHDLSNTS